MNSSNSTLIEACPCCGGDSKFAFKSQDYNRRTSARFFRHYSCCKCNFLFLHPVPDNLSDYYPPGYHYIPKSISFLQSNYKTEQYKIEIINRFKKSGRLLEIGPSLGTFAYAAKCAGFEVSTIEMDEACCRYLNEVAQIPTFRTNDPSHTLQSLPDFDVIALWHVIEHLHDPWETLRQISSRLRPNGICILATPNRNAFQLRLMGKRWPHVDSPRHLYIFSVKAIEVFARNNKMDLEFCTTNDSGSRGWNRFGWEYYTSNFTENATIRRGLVWCGSFLSRVFKIWDEIEGNGSAFTIVLRKRSH